MATIKSIEEKAKAYDEAIEKIQKYVKDDYGCTRLRPEDIFPELKESEDEKIRACIGMCLTDIDEQRFADFNTNLKECLAWLKKQGEQKPAWSEEDEVMLDKVIKRLHKHSAGDKEYLDIYYWLKAIKDRVQPQFAWKPSDEQIKVLVEVIIFAANHESPHWNDYIFGILKNLTRQLKKLRGE